MPRRIAGQRRRPDDTSGQSQAPETTPQTPGSGSESVQDDVTQATSEPSSAPAGSFFDTSEVTESDESTASDPEVDDSDPTDEQAAEQSSDVGPDSAGRSLGVLLPALLGVLLVLILALTGILGVKALRGKEAEDARQQAATAGRKAAETALSYDYRTLDKSFGAARATMTPEFAGKFDETAKVAGELATKTKATVRAEVREVGVRDGDANRVTLIIFVNQTTTSTITEGKPRVDLNRTRFTMVRNGGQWLVQEIAGL